MKPNSHDLHTKLQILLLHDYVTPRMPGTDLQWAFTEQTGSLSHSCMDAAGRIHMHPEWSTWYLSFSKLIILMCSDRSPIKAVSFSKAPLLRQSQQMWRWNSIWKDWEARHEGYSLPALSQTHSSHQVEPPVNPVLWRSEQQEKPEKEWIILSVK